MLTFSDLTATREGNQDILEQDFHNTAALHDFLIKEMLRDRIRSKTLKANDALISEELKWISIDKILSPHVYDMNELLEDEQDQFYNSQAKDDVERDPRSHAAVGFNNNVIGHARTAAGDDQSAAKTGTALTEEDILIAKNRNVFTPETFPSNDGDKYEATREDYNNGTYKSTSIWKCPFTREELIKLSQTSDPTILSKDEKIAFQLLQKYYISDEDSILGHDRLKVLAKFSKTIKSYFDKINKFEKVEEEIFRDCRANLDKIKSGEGSDLSVEEIESIISSRRGSQWNKKNLKLARKRQSILSNRSGKSAKILFVTLT
jgi:hypothetical protein